MSEIEHFSYGALTPVLAVVASVIGVLFGLLCIGRSRVMISRRAQVLWLGIAAVAIGGTGIWVMHFIAMLGFGVSKLEMRYDVAQTLLSAVIVIVAVGVGLFVATSGTPGPVSLGVGGVIAGSGIAGMHYLGMDAMKLPAHHHYEHVLVLLSGLMALAAATALLWFGRWVTGALGVSAVAVVAGAAMTGVHYTAMASLRLHGHLHMAPPEGARVIEILPLFVVGISVLTVVLLGIIMLSPNESELRDDAELLKHAQQRQVGRTGRVDRPGEPDVGGGRRSGTQAGRAGHWFGGSDAP